MGNALTVIPTPILQLMVVESRPYVDARGAFTRLFCERELAPIIGERQVRQINHSRTASVGAVRGMHFQYPPQAEMKLVRCLRGRVWDVAVDLRAESETFLQWFAIELTPASARMLVIPEGFAHGFQVMEPDSELLYLHTGLYTPTAEGGVRFDDPTLNIEWPLPVSDISNRDMQHPLIDQNFRGLN